jgi:hypothetical protein
MGKFICGLSIYLLLLLDLPSIAQHSIPDSIVASFTGEKIVLDGSLNDSAWQKVTYVANFTQRELSEGSPVTEKTEVAIVYTNVAIYIGVKCYDSDPGKIAARYMQRDFDWDQDDNFKVIISPFNDKRNGYLFVVNPNGARGDAQVTNEGENFNIDWNGVWDAFVKINREGWFIEIYIPFSTLQYPAKYHQVWGINFERNIRRKNEQGLWQGWNRNYELETISQCGELIGLEGIKGEIKWEIKPYALGGIQNSPQQYPEYLGKVGFDVNKNLLSTLKLNLTVNTDFAQVESDRLQVNLSRFSVYYPEKREFFLEGAGNYDFYLGNGNRIFYSRTIGIHDYELLPIYGGARIFGKANHTNIGFLSLQTAAKDSISSTNYSVLRISQDVGKQSSIGFITTSKYSSVENNQIIGLDGKYATSKFLKNKNLIFGGALSESFTKQSDNLNNLAYRLYCDFPNDQMDIFIGTSGIQDNFNPEMGFLRRSNYRQLYHHFAFTPRLFSRYGIRKLYFKFYEFDIYWNDATGKLESYYTEFRPLGASFNSGEWFEFNIQKNYDHPPDSFNLSDDIVIHSGIYKMTNYEIQAGSFQGRKLFAEVFYKWGDFYPGKRQIFSIAGGCNFNKHINFSLDYTYNDIKLPVGNLFTTELSGRVRYSFTNRLNVSLFTQWNSEEKFIGYNFRLHWIPKIGSDFYFVINQNYHDKISYKGLQQTNAVAKLVWRITI